MVRRILAFVRGLEEEVDGAKETQYKKGFVDCLVQVEEFILETAWNEGIDLEEDDEAT